MNWAYMHLLVNHFPIVGGILGVVLVLAGLVFKSKGVQVSGLGTLVFAALASCAAFLTGEPAESLLKTLPDPAINLIGRHEGIAAIAMYIMIPAGLLACVSLYSIWKKEKSVNILLILTLTVSLAASAVMVYTGRTGGEIRHSEFRSSKAVQLNNAPQVEADED
jgi:uncharacterized membrane protein